jgi:hypothetical protein
MQIAYEAKLAFHTQGWGPCAKGHFIHARSPDPEFFFFYTRIELFKE